MLERLQTRFEPADLDWARALAEVLLSQFEDQAQGGFYFTSADHEALLQRPKPMADESTPSGNGIAALSLQRLGHLLGEPRYLDAAARTLVAAAEPIRRLPYAHATLLMALDEQLNPPEIIVIRGPIETEAAATAAPIDASDASIRAPIGASVEEASRLGNALSQWQAMAQRDYAPRRLTLAIPPEVTGLPPALAAMQPAEQVRAYRCRGTQCEAPIEYLEQFEETLVLSA